LDGPHIWILRRGTTGGKVSPTVQRRRLTSRHNRRGNPAVHQCGCPTLTDTAPYARAPQVQCINLKTLWMLNKSTVATQDGQCANDGCLQPQNYSSRISLLCLCRRSRDFRRPTLLPHLRTSVARTEPNCPRVTINLERHVPLLCQGVTATG
jgi:hypothetical protein